MCELLVVVSIVLACFFALDYRTRISKKFTTQQREIEKKIAYIENVAANREKRRVAGPFRQSKFYRFKHAR